MTRRSKRTSTLSIDRRSLLAGAGAATASGLALAIATGADAATTTKSAKGVLVIAHLPGASAAEVKAITKDVVSGGRPKGMVTQLVGKSADGITVVTFWDDPEAQRQFVNERVKPAVKKHGAKIEISVLEVLRHYQRS
jgi:hypothetical protein